MYIRICVGVGVCLCVCVCMYVCLLHVCTFVYIYARKYVHACVGAPMGIPFCTFCPDRRWRPGRYPRLPDCSLSRNRNAAPPGEMACCVFFSAYNPDKERHTDRDLCCLRSRGLVFLWPSGPLPPVILLPPPPPSPTPHWVLNVAQPPHGSEDVKSCVVPETAGFPAEAWVELLCDGGRFSGHSPLTPRRAQVAARPIMRSVRHRGG